MAETMGVPLQPIKNFGKKEKSAWNNMLIFGDNLQVMKTLLQKKEKQSFFNTDGSMGIKLIYIDPPFATRRELRGKHDERAYQDKVAGEHFIEHLRKRLIFFRELLTDDRNE